MPQLLIIADDLTGALDSGVHFATKGINTVVRVSRKYTPNSDADVLIIDTETRHADRKLAYEIVFNIVVEAKNHGVPFFFKKTDSVLRGKIGDEIAALSDASNESIHFIPAYPSQGRTTKNGIQYVDNVPVHKSIFGNDPFTPVMGSTIKEILDINHLPVMSINEPISDNLSSRSIFVYDSESDKDVESVLKFLKEQNSHHFLAGCSGLASKLAEILHLSKMKITTQIEASDVFVLCGSLNPISENQIHYACNHGFTRIELPDGAKFSKNFLKTNLGKEFLNDFHKSCVDQSPIILDVLDGESNYQINQEDSKGNIDQGRELVSDMLGNLLWKWLEFGLNQIPVVIGGDTLMGFLRFINCDELHPICEVVSGVVLSELVFQNQKVNIISKSGGLGHLESLVDIRNRIINFSDEK